jgi:hypothetical protein
MQTMILFYSEFCQHCNVLLDTIKRFDKNNAIRLVSIDTLRSLKKPIDPKIHSVPALYLLDNKKYLFGKEVFDYLILKNKFSFAGETTRDSKKQKDQVSDTMASQPGLPQAFSLGAITAESFSSFDDQSDMINDKNYKWDIITNDNQSIMPPDTPFNMKDTRDAKDMSARDPPVRDFGIIQDRNTNIPDNLRSVNTKEVSSAPQQEKKLPSIEDIMKQRANDII